MKRLGWIYAAPWVVFYILYSLMLLSMRQTTFMEAQASTLFTVGPAAIMGIGVWKLSSLIAWSDTRRLRFFSIHAISALVYSAVWSGITVAQISFFAPPGVVTRFIDNALGWQVVMGVLMYASIASVTYVVSVSRSLAEQRTLAARAELQALRAQLNPHFLFNTLHSITSLVRQDAVKAEGALVQFGSLLRHVLDSSKSEDSTLEEELTFVRGYLAIEQMRLGDRLRVEEDIEPEALECVVPALTLQPLIENAVQHGISPRASGGTVKITAGLRGERLCIVVSDDGVGTSSPIGRSDGIGLSLVEKRLSRRFNESSPLEIESREGEGTTVTLSVPA